MQILSASRRAKRIMKSLNKEMITKFFLGSNQFSTNIPLPTINVSNKMVPVRPSFTLLF